MRNIPKCLCPLPIWFVTEPRGVPRSMGFNRYSAVTLSPLEYDRAGDYAVLDNAVQIWQDHWHWFDGVGFRVTTPWLVLVIQNCVTPGGNVTRCVRDVIKRAGGYWEFTRNEQDIQGMLWWPRRESSRAGFVAGHKAFLCGEGVCGATGKVVAGLANDPMRTDQEGLAVMLHDMDAAAGNALLGQKHQGSSGAKLGTSQLALFE